MKMLDHDRHVQAMMENLKESGHVPDALSPEELEALFRVITERIERILLAFEKDIPRGFGR